MKQSGFPASTFTPYKSYFGQGFTGPVNPSHVDTVTGGAYSAVAGTFGAIKSIGDALSFLFSVRGLQTIGGGILVLMGLYLLARQIGLPNVAGALPGPVGAAARAVPDPIQPSQMPTGERPTRQRVVNNYYLEEPPSTRRSRIAASNTYDPATSEIPF